jgi:ABC-type transporter Mla subunit MlaD
MKEEISEQEYRSIEMTNQTIDEIKQTGRTRRALEEAVADVADDLSRQQQTIRNLANNLADHADETAEQTLSAARQHLRVLATELEAAKQALQEFAEQNPTAAELDAREKALLVAADAKKQQDARAAFAENLRKRIEFYDQISLLEKQSRDQYEQAKRDWPQGIDSERLAFAGIAEGLTQFIPAAVQFFDWSATRTSLSTGKCESFTFDGLYRERKRAAEAWLQQFASK